MARRRKTFGDRVEQANRMLENDRRYHGGRYGERIMRAKAREGERAFNADPMRVWRERSAYVRKLTKKSASRGLANG